MTLRQELQIQILRILMITNELKKDCFARFFYKSITNKMPFFDEFDAIYVISMPNDTIKYNNVVNEITKTGILQCRIERFYAVSKTYLSSLRQNCNIALSNGELGCTLSHLSVMALALKRNQNKILIIEDDAFVSRTKNAQTLCNDFLKTVKDIEMSKRKEWSILYFGHMPVRKNYIGNYLFADKNEIQTYLQGSKKNYFETSDELRVYATHAYAVSKHCMKNYIRSYDQNNTNNLTLQMNDQRLFHHFQNIPHEYLVICTYPQIFYQPNNYSESSEKDRPYNELYSGATADREESHEMSKSSLSDVTS
jgi:GR25 family glycosyltransferase involved in LPS biosynthesis